MRKYQFVETKNAHTHYAFLFITKIIGVIVRDRKRGEKSEFQLQKNNADVIRMHKWLWGNVKTISCSKEENNQTALLVK